MFINGFSGGSQFAHRFAGIHGKKYVVGVSAHSGGTWDSEPGRSSSGLIWTISCGLKDTAKSKGASLPRIDYFRNFYAKMHKRKKFTVKPS